MHVSIFVRRGGYNTLCKWHKSIPWLKTQSLPIVISLQARRKKPHRTKLKMHYQPIQQRNEIMDPG